MPVVATATNAYASTPAAFADLPIASVTLEGSATGGSGTYAQWQWTLLAGPPGHTATLNNATSQNATLTGIDVWGSYYFALVVRDNLGEYSEQDPADMPDSAFTVVRVTSEHAGLVDPASGERSVYAHIREWVEAIDEMRGDFDEHTIASHDTTATGANLDTLTGGGSATGLHTHAGTDVGAATTSALGTVRLDVASDAPSSPKVINQERVPLTALVLGTLVDAGFAPGIITTSKSGATAARSHAHFYVNEACTVEGLSVAMGDGGGGTGAWAFQVWDMTPAKWAANDYTADADATLVTTLAMALPGTDHQPETGGNKDMTHSVSGGRVLAVLISSAPSEPGAALGVSINVRRKV